MENDVNTGPQIEDRVQEFHLGSEDGPPKKSYSVYPFIERIREMYLHGHMHPFNYGPLCLQEF